MKQDDMWLEALFTAASIGVLLLVSAVIVIACVEHIDAANQQATEIHAPGDDWGWLPIRTAPTDDATELPEELAEDTIEPWAYMVPEIESHLGNRPLAAYSNIIAQSCYETGMSTYWFCTISIIESGGGAHCFMPHNAWGYGQFAWSSWEESIPSFCSMFVSGYGSGLTTQSHWVYCPSGAYAPYV